jgi:glutamine amidotransferase
MCRFVAYLGPRIPLASLLTEPRNSLIRQSTHAVERSEPLNGDGFGLAWYEPSVREEPGLFRSTTPAWSNENLLDLARMVSTHCLLAHVRAASHASAVTELNCHPFRHQRYAFMHNGELGGFPLLRRALLNSLSDDAFRTIRGTTDSEHLFALFLDSLPRRDVRLEPDVLAGALRAAVGRAMELAHGHGDGEPSSLNLAVTDGRSLVTCRFTDEEDDLGESLYLHTGHRYLCVDGLCRMIDPETEGGAVIVSSERLSDDQGWRAVPRNHVAVLGPGGAASLEAMD